MSGMAIVVAVPVNPATTSAFSSVIMQALYLLLVDFQVVACRPLLLLSSDCHTVHTDGCG